MQSDEKEQNASTTYANTRLILEHMFDNQGLMERNQLNCIYVLTDGCTTQYMCSTALYLQTQIAYEYKIMYDRVIQAPGHGRDVVDSMNGHDKTYLDTVFKRACVNPMEAMENNEPQALLCHNVQEGRRICLSERWVKILSSVER